jgi:hypothetical protein
MPFSHVETTRSPPSGGTSASATNSRIAVMAASLTFSTILTSIPSLSACAVPLFCIAKRPCTHPCTPVIIDG